MGDVYKYAWLNIAALSATSDYEGFINYSRDPRVEFGFRVPLASVLGRDHEEKNGDGQECVLLQGQARLLWNFSPDTQGTNVSDPPLFKRGWVYQERNLARELANTRVLGKRYLAGLWDVNLPFQMAWITVEGQKTPARKRVGDAAYSAPSWSWASIEAPVQPRFIFPAGNGLIALADVRAAEVELETDYAFGSVTAGWLRVWGRLNRVKATERKAFYDWDKSSKSISLTDEATGEKLWFCSDTVEGHELVKSGKGTEKILWIPLTLRFDTRMVECTCLCVIEVEEKERIASKGGFVKAGEKVYRRLGTGNFGRITSMLRQDKQLMELGAYPNIQRDNVSGEDLAKGFKRKEDGLEEFVLI
jgi:hypothetical protein